MIAGEYAVLSNGYPAIVTAINRYITIEISQSTINKLSHAFMEFPETTWEVDHNGLIIGLEGEKYSFLKDAITCAYEFLKEKSVIITPFSLKIQNGLNDLITGKKIGLGSSAAIVVGVISAILEFHDEMIVKEPLELYKLSCIAHLKAQGNGSGADIAASVYGGCLLYYRYDTPWLVQKLLVQKEKICTLINLPWPNLRIEKVNLPKNARLIAGWTKQIAKTAPMVDKIETFQSNQRKNYDIFLERSKAAVDEFIKSCELEDSTGILNSIGNNRSALQYLSDITGVQIETKEISKLCKIADQYGRGKSSGAGGGDCGIAILLGDGEREILKQEWELAGIQPLDILITEQGTFIVNEFE
jgi:phosphomevalonate kinase